MRLENRFTVKILAAIALTLMTASCGFRPIYATPNGEVASTSELISINAVAAPDLVLPVVTQALKNRMRLREGANPKYELFVEVRERAERLAVQTDASVTRYNYRLTGLYTIIDRNTGKRRRGRARAVTSYNIVTSQYSTLFAENTAREKAAQILAEEIERDVLIKLVKFDEKASEEKEPVIPEIVEDDVVTPRIVREDELLNGFDEVPDPTPFDYTKQEE